MDWSRINFRVISLDPGIQKNICVKFNRNKRFHSIFSSGVRRMRQHFMQLIGTHFKYLNWRVISCLRPPFNRRRSIGNVIRATRDRHRIKELEQVATDRVQCEINRGREFVKITPRSSIHYILTYVQSFTGRPKTFAA